MTLGTKIQVGLLLSGALLLGWTWRHHAQQARALAEVRAQIEALQQAQAARQKTLEAAAQRNAELEEVERRAGNGTLLALLRERNVAHLAAAEAAVGGAAAPGLGRALAKALASRADQPAHDDSRRTKMRADLYQFFKLLDLPPEKQEQYLDLNLEKERRMADRLAALLQGKLSVEAAAQQRDQDEAANDQRVREVLGDQGKAFLDGIADGMRNDTAKLMLGLLQQNLGDYRLSPEQGTQLQALLKSEIVPVKMDDVELFRSPEAWAQYYLGVQQKVAEAAAGFLTPAQMEALKAIAAYDLDQRQKQMAARRTALGIK
jgi:hypothetical protein